MFGKLKHTDRQKALEKIGLTTLRRQRCFRFTKGASHHRSVNLNMSHCEMGHGPPKNRQWPIRREPLF